MTLPQHTGNAVHPTTIAVQWNENEFIIVIHSSSSDWIPNLHQLRKSMECTCGGCGTFSFSGWWLGGSFPVMPMTNRLSRAWDALPHPHSAFLVCKKPPLVTQTCSIMIGRFHNEIDQCLLLLLLSEGDCRWISHRKLGFIVVMRSHVEHGRSTHPPQLDNHFDISLTRCSNEWLLTRCVVMKIIDASVITNS